MDGGCGLGVGMVVGFGAVIALNGTAWAGAGRYIDPAMVIAACVVLVPAPFGMVRSTLVELLGGCPRRAGSATGSLGGR